MGFGSKTRMLLLISFVFTSLISIVGMGMITNAIFSTPKKSYCTIPTSTTPSITIPGCLSGPDGNIFTITDSELIISKIALGFYWSLSVIAFILSVYIYGFTN